MVVNVNYDDLKTQIMDMIEAAMRGDKVVITKDGKQIVQLVPMKTARKPKFGSARVKLNLPMTSMPPWQISVSTCREFAVRHAYVSLVHCGGFISEQNCACRH